MFIRVQRVVLILSVWVIALSPGVGRDGVADNLDDDAVWSSIDCGSEEQAEISLKESSCQAELESARRAAERQQGCQTDLNACQERLSKTPLVVVTQWATHSHDIDLHIVDPAGKEFYFENKSFSGHPGELSADTTSGPGVEIWEVPEALPGRYRVLYNLYDKDENNAPAKVKGGVYHRDGHDRLGERRLTRVGRKEMIAEITVGADGDVEISMR